MKHVQTQRTYKIRIDEPGLECQFEMIVVQNKIIDTTFRLIDGTFMDRHIGLSEDQRKQVINYFSHLSEDDLNMSTGALIQELDKRFKHLHIKYNQATIALAECQKDG